MQLSFILYSKCPHTEPAIKIQARKRCQKNVSADLPTTDRSINSPSHSSSSSPSSSPSSPSSSDTSKPASLIRALSRLRFVLISSSNTSRSSCSFSTSFFFPSVSSKTASRVAIRTWRSSSCLDASVPSQKKKKDRDRDRDGERADVPVQKSSW